MRILVKIGGTLLDSPDTRQALAGQIALAQSNGYECVVVHGGGKQLTRFLEDRGVPSRFVNGLRVTTPETIDAVLKVLAGSVNQELVSALVRARVVAVGLSGLDGNLVEAVQMDPDLGAVGRVTKSNGALLELLTANGYLPVVACLAGDASGNFYNVNGDQMAVACAAGYHAEKLIFLTDVPGVLDAEGKRLPRLTPPDIERLIESGVAKGGMQAKLNAASSAIAQGIAAVAIVPGAENSILTRVLAGETVGTQVEKSGELNLHKTNM
jgi:acetylglutamate kinase